MERTYISLSLVGPSHPQHEADPSVLLCVMLYPHKPSLCFPRANVSDFVLPWRGIFLFLLEAAADMLLGNYYAGALRAPLLMEERFQCAQ